MLDWNIDTFDIAAARAAPKMRCFRSFSDGFFLATAFGLGSDVELHPNLITVKMTDNYLSKDKLAQLMAGVFIYQGRSFEFSNLETEEYGYGSTYVRIIAEFRPSN